MNYREEVMRTGNSKLDFKGKLGNAGLGIAGESGEVADLIKKIVYHDKVLDDETREKLVKEMGDVRWYLEFLAATLDIPMEEIERKNIEKLRARYPRGFNPADANKRRDDEIRQQ